MHPRRLLVWAIVLALTGGLVWWSSQTKKDEEGKSPGEAAKKILTLTAADLRKVEIERREAEKTVLESADGSAWRLTSPAPYETDKEAVNSLTSALSALQAEEVVEEKATDFASYGLSTPSIVITLTVKGGKTHRILLGDESPVGGGSYARLDGDARLFTIASFNKTSIDKFAADLRDRRLLTLDFDKLARVAISSPKGNVEFGKNALGDWQIIQPAPMRADGWAVEEVLRKLREAKLDATLTTEEQADVARVFPATPLVATVSLTGPASTQTLEIRKKEAKFYARSSALQGVWVVQGDPLDGLDKTAAEFRTKKLFDFGFSEPSRVNFKGPSKSLVLSKSGEVWSSGGKAMDNVGVQSLIDRLRELAASGFASGAAPAPVLEIQVDSKEGKQIEKVLLGKSGESWIATREGEATLYQLDAKTVDELQKTASDVKEAPPPPQAKKK